MFVEILKGSGFRRSTNPKHQTIIPLFLRLLYIVYNMHTLENITILILLLSSKLEDHCFLTNLDPTILAR